MNNHLSRRALTKGAAWAAPVVLASAAIPAYAASTRQMSLEGSGRITKNTNWAGTETDGLKNYKIYTTDPGYYVEGTQAGDTIDNFRITIWLAGPNAIFSPGDFTSPDGWTTLTRDPSTSNEVRDGKTYYAYTMTFTDEIFALDGRTYLHGFSFESDFSSAPDPETEGAFKIVSSIDVNGRTLSFDAWSIITVAT